MTHINILEIQNAIDRYEKAFPRNPSPSAVEALGWQAGRGKLLRARLAIRKVVARLIHETRTRIGDLGLPLVEKVR
jgi:hypothetical protein